MARLIVKHPMVAIATKARELVGNYMNWSWSEVLEVCQPWETRKPWVFTLADDYILDLGVKLEEIGCEVSIDI